jgi:hypothetical protein
MQELEEGREIVEKDIRNKKQADKTFKMKKKSLQESYKTTLAK